MKIAAEEGFRFRARIWVGYDWRGRAHVMKSRVPGRREIPLELSLFCEVPPKEETPSRFVMGKLPGQEAFTDAEILL
ncbi:MAG: hypothetical protein JWM68_4013 [Verrucomicrobiales bacterium]|nr:hypothetical protein [Verrucomicrobiales bacterium]